MKSLILFTALLITITNVHMAQASIAHYNVSIVFLDDTTFTGSFNYDYSNQQVSNLQGKLDDVLMGNVEPLNYQLNAGSDGKGGINASVYALNTTAISTNPPINNNAYVTINFNAANPTLGATDLAQLAYMDCTAQALMGSVCMYDLAWHDPVFPMAGGAGVLSETITTSDQVPPVQPPQTSNPIAPADCLLNWAEKNYPQLFAPAGAASQTQSPYYYRHYQNTNAYVGISSDNNHVYYLGPDGNLLDAGQLSTWLTTAGC
ncbi:MAG: hypothetical protein HOP02_11265 [Methylococcaceae bacterium]|nr:hypothetical protein [Methylococcaceae bacterium]